MSAYPPVKVAGKTRWPLEVFRAVGVTWIRYEHTNGTNGYATADEWLIWGYQEKS